MKNSVGPMSAAKRWNKFFYRNPKGAIDSDSQWRQQNEQTKTNKVYKMVDFSGGGWFIKEYDKGNTEEEKKQRILNYFAKEIAPQCLCEGVEMVTKDDYEKWHREQNHLTKTLMEIKEVHSHQSTFRNAGIIFHSSDAKKDADKISVISLDTVVTPYVQHEIKWKLEERGAIGETPIHLLFLNGTPKHIKIAEILLEEYPQLAVDVYEGYEYYGESCLHFAIIQNNLDAVNILLQTKQVDLHAQARGKFFIPVDVKRGNIRLRKQNFEGYAYYGEFPLSFAASRGNHMIYDALINAGCDPKRVDRHGNNVLHLTVIHDQPDMYYYALKHPKAKPNPDEYNQAKLTPLALAAKLGKTQMFKKILEISSHHYWSYNTVTCSAYPLKFLDTIGPSGETDWNSALMMIIRGRKKEHLDLVSDPVVHQLLNQKWKKFGRGKFIRLLLAFIVHFLFLSVAIYLRPNVQSDLRYGTSGYDIARYVFESLVVGESCIVIMFSIREIFLESFSGFWQNLTSIPSRVLYIISVVLLVICIPFRFLELYNVEEWLLIFAVPGLWSYMLFFLRNSSLTGPFITMIIQIFTTDLARFTVIYSIILLTSAVGFFYQYEGQGIDAFLTELGTFMTLFQMSLGEFDYMTILQGKYEALAIIMFISFMILVNILLLNMLIAMITRTFEKITKRSEKVWRRQWASMVVTMERSHVPESKIQFQRSYDMNIKATRATKEGDVMDTDRTMPLKAAADNRALMVVQHQKSSETQRRKATQSRWKQITKQATTERAPETPLPQLQIKSLAGLSDFIHDAPKQEESEDENIGIFERVSSALSRVADNVAYSDGEDEYEA